MKFAEFPLFDFDYEVTTNTRSATIRKTERNRLMRSCRNVLYADVTLFEKEAEIGTVHRLLCQVTEVYRHAQNKPVI